MIDLLSRLADKVGSVGALTGAMSCAACFPAFASLGAALGLGFLAQYEGLMLNTLLPIFAGVAGGAALLAWWHHRQGIRLVAGLAGPAMVLGTLYPFWQYAWSTPMFYLGIATMLAASIWDIVSPPRLCNSAPTK